jgi:dolichyl-phosphate-mannose-protein mannosyltransferase
MTSSREEGARVALIAFAAASAALFIVRLVAAARVGFGDSEALYASYALHPQPAYLDHPGLIGIVARALGGGAAPTPSQAHVMTSLVSTIVPWLMALTCRACGATWRRSLAAGLATAVVPEMAIGLFGLTPDLLLAPSWIGSLGLAAFALRQPPAKPLAALAFAGAGLLAGVAATSKVSGLLLVLALGATYASPASRRHARTLGPWAGLVTALLVLEPIASYEFARGWPMIQHRLVDTQRDAGWSLRNAAALLGGQALYLSPGVALLGVQALRGLWRERQDPVGTLLFSACVVPAAALVPLCLWSRVAEPHWVTPALLALVAVSARGADPPTARRLIAAATLAGAMVVAVYAWALIPTAVRLASRSWDPKLDITSELYGWPEVTRQVKDELDATRSSVAAFDDIAVVGPHWVLCAQLEASLEGGARVGCNTPVADDFDEWWPRGRWRDAQVIIWVTDARFGPPPDLPRYATLRSRDIPIRRAGRVIRVFTVAVLTRSALARLPPHGQGEPGMAARPAAFKSARSSSVSGFGVVSSLSPKNIEFAPAYIASTCASRVSSERPALNRTRARGIKIRAHATILTRSSGSTGGRCSKGVP